MSLPSHLDCAADGTVYASGHALGIGNASLVLTLMSLPAGTVRAVAGGGDTTAAIVGQLHCARWAAGRLES